MKKNEIKSLFETLAAKHGRVNPDVNGIVRVMRANKVSIKQVETLCRQVGVTLPPSLVDNILSTYKDAERAALNSRVCYY